MFSALRTAAAATSKAPAAVTTSSAAALARGIATSSAARDVSRLTLVGRVAGVSDARQTANGSKFVAYTIATTDPVISRDQPPTTTFHRVYAFGDRTVERVNRLGKGDLVYAEADLRIERVLGSESQPNSERVLTAHRTLHLTFACLAKLRGGKSHMNR